MFPIINFEYNIINTSNGKWNNDDISIGDLNISECSQHLLFMNNMLIDVYERSIGTASSAVATSPRHFATRQVKLISRTS